MSPHATPKAARWGLWLSLVALTLLLTTCLPVAPAPVAAPADMSVRAAHLPIGAAPATSVQLDSDPLSLWAAPRALDAKATIGLALQKSSMVRRVELSTLVRPTPPAGGARPTPGPAVQPLAEAELIVRNLSDAPICYVYISPITDPAWGDDWLAGEEAIAPDGERAFLLPPGHYDLRADDCRGRVVDEAPNAHIQVLILWLVHGAADTAAAPTATPPVAATATPQATAIPTPRPILPTEFLCCGQTAGETRIWGIGYPGDWRAETIPANSARWLAASFTSPADDIRILIAPSAWTPMGTPMDIGDVDLYLNAMNQDQRSRSRDFAEFMRRPLPGINNGRLWSATWWEGDRQFYASYLVIVTPMPIVEGLPRGTLTALGFQAEASQWRSADTLYEAMLRSLRVEVIRSGAAYVAPDAEAPQDAEAAGMAEAGSSSTTFWELLFCPVACAWEYVDIANQPAGQVWQCSDGCIGQLSKVPCGQCY